MKVAVILFPGSNCELEAVRACKRAKLQTDLLRWNEDPKIIKGYDAFIIPGGFAYEDRSRAGVIASKDPVMQLIKSEAANGKPVLGICNGAQVLVECGMVPGLNAENLEMALAWNERIKNGKLLGVGFYNDWIYIRSDVKKNRTPFNRFDQNIVMRIAVANGEGRYTTRNKEVIEKLIQNEQTVFRFCDSNGKISNEFPINPNGAMYNISGVCNYQGNVVSLMPHPERTISGQPVFDSLADYFNQSKKIIVNKNPQKQAIPKAIDEKIEKENNPADIVIKVKLIITDNEERTIENVMKNYGFKDLQLKREIYYGFYLKNKSDLKTVAEKIIGCGEIINLNKEIPTIQIGKKIYGYNKNSGLFEKPLPQQKNTSRSCAQFYTAEYDNYLGKSIQLKLEKYFTKKEITKVERGVSWEILLKKPERVQDLIKTHIFHNPHSMKIVQMA